VDGKSIKVCEGLSAGFFDRLQVLVNEFHRRGILYFDLRHKSNVIVRNGDPFIIWFLNRIVRGD